MVRKAKTILCIMTFAILLLCSCDKTSRIAKKPEFINKLHLIRNPETYATMIVRGDGSVVLQTMEPDNEQLGIIEDVNEDSVNFIYKTFSGEDIYKSVYGDEDFQYESMDLTVRTVYYDKDGKEVGLSADSYGGHYTSKNKIIYRDNSVPYGENDLKVYDIRTKEIKELPYRQIYTFNGNFLMSTDGYDDELTEEFTIIYDEDFNELNRIEGYSLNSVDKRKGAYVVCLSRREKSDSSEEGYIRKYNYLDKNYKFVFDEDIDKRIWGETFPILTVVRGNVEFDFDFAKLKKVSEDRPYVDEDSKEEVFTEEDMEREEENIKKRLGTEYIVSKINKFGKTFYTTGMYPDYSTRRDFEMYDENFNLMYEHLNAVESYTFDDYIVISRENDTILIDKNLAIVKKYDSRIIDIRGWYSDSSEYKIFEDLQTGRMGIINKNLDIVIDNLMYVGSMEEDYFTYKNGFKYGLMDYEGIPILTYSIFDTMREDAVERDFGGKLIYEYY